MFFSCVVEVQAEGPKVFTHHSFTATDITKASAEAVEAFKKQCVGEPPKAFTVATHYVDILEHVLALEAPDGTRVKSVALPQFSAEGRIVGVIHLDAPEQRVGRATLTALPMAG
jgi:hypothetical protein